MSNHPSEIDPETGWKCCPLCGRPIPPSRESKHHLIPKLKGGKHGPIAVLHEICHGKIHSVFTEAELARSYSTIEDLQAHEEIEKFIKWVKKRPPEYKSSNREITGDDEWKNHAAQKSATKPC